MTADACISDADLARLWDGDVTQRERDAFRQHLDACSRCGQRWERMAAGAERLESAFGVAGSSEPQGPCPSDDLIAGYVDGSLDPQQHEAVETHLAECGLCSRQVFEARLLCEDYDREGDAWWSRHVAMGLLRLFARAGEYVEELAEAIGATPSLGGPAQVIKLPILEPAREVERRLAADTGEGLAEHVIHQEDPPFELHLSQFGRQLRVTVQAAQGDSPYRDCLGRLELWERDRCLLSRMVLVEGGRGRCVLGPDETERIRPGRTQAGVRFSPLVTMGQLIEAGDGAYVPILGKLLGHRDPSIRRAAIEVLALLSDPAIPSLIEPLIEDTEESVRSTARKVLAMLTGRGD